MYRAVCCILRMHITSRNVANMKATLAYTKIKCCEAVPTPPQNAAQRSGDHDQGTKARAFLVPYTSNQFPFDYLLREITDGTPAGIHAWWLYTTPRETSLAAAGQRRSSKAVDPAKGQSVESRYHSNGRLPEHRGGNQPP